MKLSECKYGVLVIKDQKIGMVVGLAENTCKEAIPLVQWQDGETYSIHHANISLYEQ